MMGLQMGKRTGNMNKVINFLLDTIGFAVFLFLIFWGFIVFVLALISFIVWEIPTFTAAGVWTMIRVSVSLGVIFGVIFARD